MRKCVAVAGSGRSEGIPHGGAGAGASGGALAQFACKRQVSRAFHLGAHSLLACIDFSQRMLARLYGHLPLPCHVAHVIADCAASRVSGGTWSADCTLMLRPPTSNYSLPSHPPHMHPPATSLPLTALPQAHLCPSAQPLLSPPSSALASRSLCGPPAAPPAAARGPYSPTSSHPLPPATHHPADRPSKPRPLPAASVPPQTLDNPSPCPRPPPAESRPNPTRPLARLSTARNRPQQMLVGGTAKRRQQQQGTPTPAAQLATSINGSRCRPGGSSL